MSNFEPFTLKPQTTDNYINLYMYLYVSFNCILLYVLYTQIFVLSVFDVLCHLNLIVSAAVGLTELSLNKGSLTKKKGGCILNFTVTSTVTVFTDCCTFTSALSCL